MTPPVLVSIVVCDSVYNDASTGKTALVGIFNSITAGQFPMTHNRCCVFVSVTDARKETQFRLRIVHSESEKIVIEMKGPASKDTTPLHMCDFCFELNNLVFPEPGVYLVEFWGDDKILVQRPVRLVERAKKKG